MNILSKLFKKQKKEEPVKKIIPRAHRLKTTPLTHIRLTIEQEGQKIPLSIANLSFSGIGILQSSLSSWPSPGETLSGTLFFQKESIEVLIKIIHFSETTVGCMFIDPAPHLSETIKNYFDVELNAAKLNFVNPKILAQQSDGQPYWFQGGSHCELYFVKNEGLIVRFHISYFGNYIEGGENLPTRYGMLNEDESHPMKPKSSDTIRYLEQIDPSFLEQMKRFLENISKLENEDKEKILSFVSKLIS